MKPGRYCVVYNSSTVGKSDRLDGRFKKRKEAEMHARTMNRGAGMGGFYSVHICKNLGYEAKQKLGLEGKKRRH